MPNRALLLLIAAALAACAPPAEVPPDSTPAPARETTAAERLVGTVRVVGSAPINVQVVLQPENGRSVRLTGPLQAELRELSGAEVAVTGAVGPAPDPMVDRQIEVGDYEVLAVNGEPVVMGVVERRTSSWTILRTPAGEMVYLASAPEEMQVGQKVWVQGPRARIVQSYGVVRR